MKAVSRQILLVALCALLSACEAAATAAPVASPVQATTPSAPVSAATAVPVASVTAAGPAGGPTRPAVASTPAGPDTDLELAQRFAGTDAYAYVKYLTSPELEGRKAGAPGADRAADYIAGQFRAAGVKPAGDDGTYFQNLTLPFIDLAEAPVLALLNADGTVARQFKHRLEFSEVIGGRAGDGQGSGRLVFVGRGTSKDFALAGDITGTVAMVEPAPNTPRDLITQLSARGVLGLVEITSNPANLLVRYSYIPSSMIFDGMRPTVIVSAAAANELLKGSGANLLDLEDKLNHDGAAFVSTPNTVRLSVRLAPVHDAPTKNVLAVLPGSDPALAGQVVIVGGHYDHVGVDPGGLLFQGANDNASGAGVVVGLAQFFAQYNVQPKRTIVFAAWTGEEAGLVGSQFYVTHPKFPLKQTIGYVNLDVVGAGDGDGLTITNDAPAVGSVARASATSLGIPFNGAAIGGGSDHESFLHAGVPATFFIWQRYGDIHVPSDTFDKIDPIKLQKTGQVAALTLLRLANASQ